MTPRAGDQLTLSSRRAQQPPTLPEGGSPQDETEGREMADKMIDARGASCPIPVLKAKKGIGDVPPGGTLEVLSSDPGSLTDFPAFCAATGHMLLEHGEVSAGVYRFLIRRAA